MYMFQSILEHLGTGFPVACDLSCISVDMLRQLAVSTVSFYSCLSEYCSTAFIEIGGGEIGAEGAEVFDQFDDGHLVEVFVLHDAFFADIGRPAT